jgi:hypothetical protein
MRGIKRSLLHDIVNKHQIDASGVSAFFQDSRPEHFFRTHDLFSEIGASLVTGVECFEPFCVCVKGLVEIGHFVGIKERDVAASGKSSPEKRIQDHTIVHVPHTGLVGALIVLEHDEVVKLIVPYRIEHRGRCIADTALRTRS